jgi:ABC-type glycerol-3-phosphate transport system permease component
MIAQAWRLLATVMAHALLGVAAVVVALPMIWMARYAASDNGAGLRRLFDGQLPVWRWVLNSIFLASTYTVLVVLLCALAGFAIAKYDFVGKRAAMVVMLLTVLVPPQVLLPAGFELTAWLGWVDTYPAAIVPGLANVFGVLLFTSAMRAVNDDVLAAARIDGCGEWRLWWSIALPLVRPMVGAFTLISFLASWNSFLWPQIVLIDAAKHTLPIGMANLTALPQTGGPAVVYAAVLVGIVPAAVLFVLLQRDLVEGLTSGATVD